MKNLRKERKTTYSDQERKKMELMYAYLDGKHCNCPNGINPNYNYKVYGSNYEDDIDLMIKFTEGFVDGLAYRNP